MLCDYIVIRETVRAQISFKSLGRSIYHCPKCASSSEPQRYRRPNKSNCFCLICFVWPWDLPFRYKNQINTQLKLPFALAGIASSKFVKAMNLLRGPFIFAEIMKPDPLFIKYFLRYRSNYKWQKQIKPGFFATKTSLDYTAQKPSCLRKKCLRSSQTATPDAAPWKN